MKIAIVGLGKMGANMARRLMRHDIACSVFDLDRGHVEQLVREGAESVEDLVGKLGAPRTIWLMVPAGRAVDASVDKLFALLEPGDTLIDGGNSHYNLFRFLQVRFGHVSWERVVSGPGLATLYDFLRLSGYSEETANVTARIAASEEDWRQWGPYLSERAWGTVREDYSPDGTAWEHFDHEQARSRAYRWSEDGLGGICDEQQRQCLALALWNGRDPFLKQRAFGLTGNQGNHGEDVKACYFYLDATPTHSYLHYRYKYPQGEFPYRTLVKDNARRGRSQPPYQLADTDVFDGGRYDESSDFYDAELEFHQGGDWTWELMRPIQTSP